jgi:5-methylcytosine-specific restriction enzyme subunit McrC
MQIVKEHKNLTLWQGFDFDNLEKYLNTVWQNRHTLYDEQDEEQETSRQQLFLSLLRAQEVKANQYVGFLQFKELNLCIYPKLFHELGEGSITLFYRHLVYWLSYCRRINFPFNHIVAELTHTNDFAEALIYYFAKRTYTLLQQYPYHQFEIVEEALGQVKGRLLTSRYIQESLIKGNFHHLTCEHEPLQFDNILNSIIKYVIRKLIRNSRFKETWYYLEQILFLLDEVEDEYITAADCDKVRLNPLFTEYRECLDMCRFFLNNEQIQGLLGAENHFCFLLPMNYVFEDYLCGFIEDKFKSLYKSAYQQSGWLTDQKVFRIKNDIVLQDGDKELLLIIDTKYKLRQRGEDPKRGISQTDLYQMLAYAIRHNCKKVLLLYPLMHGQHANQDVDIFTISSQLFEGGISIMAADLQICHPDVKQLDQIVFEQLRVVIDKALNCSAFQ